MCRPQKQIVGGESIRRLAALVIVVTSALSSGCSSVATESPGLPIAMITTEFIGALNARAFDEEALWDKLADEFEHRVSQASLRTRKDLHDFFRKWDDLFVGWKYVETRRVVEGNSVAWEGRAEAIHAETGRQLILPIVMIIEIDELGKVKSVHVYLDTGLIQRQIVGEPAI